MQSKEAILYLMCVVAEADGDGFSPEERYHVGALLGIYIDMTLVREVDQTMILYITEYKKNGEAANIKHFLSFIGNEHYRAILSLLIELAYIDDNQDHNKWGCLNIIRKEMGISGKEFEYLIQQSQQRISLSGRSATEYKYVELLKYN